MSTSLPIGTFIKARALVGWITDVWDANQYGVRYHDGVKIRTAVRRRADLKVISRDEAIIYWRHKGDTAMLYADDFPSPTPLPEMVTITRAEYTQLQDRANRGETKEERYNRVVKQSYR